MEHHQQQQQQQQQKHETLSVIVQPHDDSRDSQLLSPGKLTPSSEMIDTSDFRSLNEPTYQTLTSVNGRMSPPGFSPNSSYATLTPLQPLPPISTMSDKFAYGHGSNISGTFTVMPSNNVDVSLGMGVQSPYAYDKLPSMGISPPHSYSSPTGTLAGIGISQQPSPLSPQSTYSQNGLASPQKSISPGAGGYDSPYNSHRDLLSNNSTGGRQNVTITTSAASPTLSPQSGGGSLHSPGGATDSSFIVHAANSSSFKLNGLLASPQPQHQQMQHHGTAPGQSQAQNTTNLVQISNLPAHQPAQQQPHNQNAQQLQHHNHQQNRDLLLAQSPSPPPSNMLMQQGGNQHHQQQQQSQPQQPLLTTVKAINNNNTSHNLNLGLNSNNSSSTQAPAPTNGGNSNKSPPNCKGSQNAPVGGSSQSTSSLNSSDVEEINTKELAQRISAELKRYSIPQAIFAQRVLCRSQGTLSDLLRNPKPWSKLKSGRETFRRMFKWLQEPEYQRMSALRLAGELHFWIILLPKALKNVGEAEKSVEELWSHVFNELHGF